MTSVPFLSGEAVAREWLRCAYGDDETDAAMALPTWELRIRLYPEILTYGPAGSQVEKFFNAVRAAKSSSRLHVAFASLTIQIEGARESFLIPEADYADRFLFGLLDEEATTAFRASHGDGVAECVAVVAMALSAQWLGAAARVQFATFEREVNGVLAAVDLPDVNLDAGDHV